MLSDHAAGIHIEPSPPGCARRRVHSATERSSALSAELKVSALEALTLAPAGAVSESNRPQGGSWDGDDEVKVSRFGTLISLKVFYVIEHRPRIS